MVKRKRLEVHNKERITKSNPKKRYMLPDKAHEWKRSDLKRFKAKVVHSQAPFYSKDELPDSYKELFLNGWGKSEILNKDLSQLSVGGRSIIRKLRNIINPDVDFPNYEARVGCFINALFYKLDFTKRPYRFFLRFPFTTFIDDILYENILDFVIYKDKEILFVLYDKSIVDPKLYNNWGENQVIGDIIMFALRTACARFSLAPITINAIKLMGTRFTFYKAELSSKYLEDCYDLESKEDLIIERYPEKRKCSNIPALDFSDENDRFYILNKLYSIFNPIPEKL